jgi:hypothetical protein
VVYNGKKPEMIKNKRDERHTVLLFFFIGGGLWGLLIEISCGKLPPAAVNSGLSPKFLATQAKFTHSQDEYQMLLFFSVENICYM